MGLRICPLCETVTADEVCAEHGCPTVDRALYDLQEEALKPGTVIAKRFKIMKLLGKGAMGSVFLGEQLSVNRKVAIKTLQRGMVSDQGMVRRFYLEARAASQLDHPNIVKIYDFGVDDDSEVPYIAMEFVDGVTLDQHIEGKFGIPEEDACRLLSQVCKGLVAAHDAGIVHRDLKPDNIYVRVLADGDEQVKVLDFGIAKVVRGDDEEGDLTATGMTLGTPAFMAPEQIRARDIDFRADLYSIGCILHLLLTGESPFAEGDNMATMMAHLTNPPPTLPPTFHDGKAPTENLVRLHGSLLSKDPKHRPTSTASLAKALKLLGQGKVFDIEEVLGEVIAIQKRDSPYRTQPFDADPMARTGLSDAAAFQDTMAGEISATDIQDAVDTAQLKAAEAAAARAAAEGAKKSPMGLILAAVALLAIGGGVALMSGGDEAPAPTSTKAAKTAPLAAKAEADKSSAASAEAPDAPASAPTAKEAPAAAPAPTPAPAPEPAEPALPVYTIALETTPAGAEVRLGQAVMGMTPMTVTLKEGEAEKTVTLSHPEYESMTLLASRDTASPLMLRLKPKVVAPAPKPKAKASTKRRAKRSKPAASKPAAPAPKPKPKPKPKKKAIQVW